MRPRRKPLPPRVRDLPTRQPAPVRPDRPPLPTDPGTLPPLPEAYHATLDAGLKALRLTLGADQLARLEDYVRLLLAWTAAINLTAIREPVAVAREHLLDSLSAVGILARLESRTILDLGSGGGLPGVPLAIAQPDVRVLLVESVGKKAAFLRVVVAALDLQDRVEVANERAEALTARRAGARWDAVTVRAVAALPDLVDLAFPLLRPGGSLIAWKRGDLEAELAACRTAVARRGGTAADIEVIGVPVPDLADHRLVVVTKPGNRAVTKPL